MSKHKENRRGAIALGYNEKEPAPKVLAKGFGSVADEIINIGDESGVLIKEDEQLFNSLRKLNVGEEIPPKLYLTVAEILAFVYRINKKKRG
jgi:flagellar biosynthesis protein